MFPEVQAKQRSQVAVEFSKLVMNLCLSVFKLHAGFVVRKPDPSGSVKLCALSVEKRNHIFEAAPLITYELMDAGKLSGKVPT